MSRYNFLDSKGLAKYHQLSGYSRVPIDNYSRGTLNPSTGEVVASGGGTTTSVVTDYIELPVYRKYSVDITGSGGCICFYSANDEFVSSKTFDNSVSFVLNDKIKDGLIKATKFRVSAPRIASEIDSDDTQFVIRSLHDNATKWLHDEISDNKAAIADNFNLIAKLHASHGVSVSPSTIEKGVKTNISISNFYFRLGSDTMTPDGAVTTTGGSFDSILNTGGTVTVEDVSDTTSFSYKIIHLGKEFTGSRTVSAYYPMYFGSSTIETLTSSNLNSIFTSPGSGNSVGVFAKQGIKSSPTGTYNVTVTQGNFIYLIVPTGMTINTVKSGGFDVPMNPVQQVSGTDKGTYNVYRSASQVNGGTVTLVIS